MLSGRNRSPPNKKKLAYLRDGLGLVIKRRRGTRERPLLARSGHWADRAEWLILTQSGHSRPAACQAPNLGCRYADAGDPITRSSFPDPRRPDCPLTFTPLASSRGISSSHFLFQQEFNAGISGHFCSYSQPREAGQALSLFKISWRSRQCRNTCRN